MRDRWIIWTVIVTQIAALLCRIPTVATAVCAFVMASFGLFVSSRPYHSVTSIPSQRTLGSTYFKSISLRWRLIGVLLLVALIQYFSTNHDLQKSLVIAICEWTLPCLVLGQAFLFMMLLWDRTANRTVIREGDGRLILPMACGTMILLMVHWQHQSKSDWRLLASIIAVAVFAFLSSSITRGDWLVQPIHSDPQLKAKIVKRFRRGASTATLRPTLVILAAFSSIAWPLSLAIDSELPNVQNWFDSMIYKRATVDSFGNLGLTNRYVEEATLTSINDQIFDSPQGIAFRVYCDVLPGYMRGRVFESYENGRWLNAGYESGVSNGRQLIAMKSSVGRSVNGTELNRFSVTSGSTGKHIAVEVQNDPVRGNFYFTPLGADVIEGRGNRIRVDRNDIPRAGLSVQDPYRAIVFAQKNGRTFDKNSQAIYLRPSPHHQAEIAQLAETIFVDCPTTTRKAAAIQAYFQNQFSYSLDAPKAPAGVDPVIHFLRQKHPAHCEYFATATALLLRSAAVPTRYVTGYVVSERNDSGDYWVARNLNAHAWVEAYDSDMQQWFVVEATPGRTFEGLDFSDDAATRRRNLATTGGTDTNDTRWQQFWDWLTSSSSLGRFLRWSNFAQIPLAIAVLILLFIRFLPSAYNRLRRNRKVDRYQRILKDLDTKSNRCGFERRPQETLNHFADRLEQRAAQDPAVTHLVDQYRRYALSRYGGAPWQF
jgi:transglutaminase-like putative cysteine protease